MDLDGGLVLIRDGSVVLLKSFDRRDLKVKGKLEGPALERYWSRKGESPRQQLWNLVNAGLSRLRRRPLDAYALRRDSTGWWSALVDARWAGLLRTSGLTRRPPGVDFDLDYRVYEARRAPIQVLSLPDGRTLASSLRGDNRKRKNATDREAGQSTAEG